MHKGGASDISAHTWKWSGTRDSSADHGIRGIFKGTDTLLYRCAPDLSTDKCECYFLPFFNKEFIYGKHYDSRMFILSHY